MSSDFTWGETPNDPTVPLPDGSQEVLEFQADKALDRIIVDVGTGDELCAYRAGAFRGSFAARSSVDGSNNVRLFRDGGWPAPPKVIPKVVDSGGAFPSLQPLNGAYAAWAMDDGTDRTGNAHTIAVLSQFPVVQSRRGPGHKSLLFYGGQGSTESVGLNVPSLTAQHFRLNGLSMSFAVCVLAPNAFGADSEWAINFTTASDNWQVWGIKQTSRNVTYVADPNGGHESDLPVPIGTYVHGCVAVDPAGTVLLGCAGAYQTLTVGNIGSGADSSTLRFGCTTFGGGNDYACMMILDDLALWDGVQTQAFFEAQRLSMGL